MSGLRNAAAAPVVSHGRNSAAVAALVMGLVRNKRRQD
jgi:hypothetical protein